MQFTLYPELRSFRNLQQEESVCSTDILPIYLPSSEPLVL